MYAQSTVVGNRALVDTGSKHLAIGLPNVDEAKLLTPKGGQSQMSITLPKYGGSYGVIVKFHICWRD